MGILYNTSPSTVSKRKHNFRFQIILDEHLTSSGGPLVQDVVGPITPVTITADSGYTLMPPVVTPWGMSALLPDLTTCTIRGIPRADTIIRCSATGSLLPFSDQSKIVTYATSDNFVDGASTWGEGICPIKEKFTKTSSGYVLADVRQVDITNINVIGNAFTIYEVLYQNADTSIGDYNFPNIEIYRGNQSQGYTNDELFQPRWSSARQYYYDSDPGGATYCDFSSLSQVHITAAAYEYLPNSQRTNVYVRCNDTARSQYRNQRVGNISHIYIGGQDEHTKRYYKFIGIVMEKESSAVIQNNIDYLKQYYFITY